MAAKRKSSNGLWYVVAFFLLGLLIYAVTKSGSTDDESFAYEGVQIEQYCQQRNLPQEQCNRLMGRRGGSSGEQDNSQVSEDETVLAWCNQKCGGNGRFASLCEDICYNANTGSNCQSECGRFDRPQVFQGCLRKCQNLIIPSP